MSFPLFMSGAITPTAFTTLGSIVVGPLEFARPAWLLLIPITFALTLLISRRSLQGGTAPARWMAVIVRLIVLTLISCALAEPALRDESKDVSVTVVLDASSSVPDQAQRAVEQFVTESTGLKAPGDRLGAVTAARNALVQQLPSKLTDAVERRFIGRTDGTDLAEAVQLAIATAPEDAASRILLATDGNETQGSLLAAAEAARAAGVPIDVYPVRYIYPNEVIVERVTVPTNARLGETINVRVVVNATRPSRGTLNILMNDRPIDLNPDADGVGMFVTLRPGPNLLMVPIETPSEGAQSFEAIFEPEQLASGELDDGIAENNRALGVSFVSGEGRVLVIQNDDTALPEAASLVRTLTEAEIGTVVATPGEVPAGVTDLASYDAIILVNQESYAFTQQQQEALRQYVHDIGGGLLMIGGDRSFGAGGWIGSPLEDALPIRLDPPQKRNMPQGALVLVIHSVEMPQGVFWGKKVSEAAVDALSRLDKVGIVEFQGMGGTDWVHPISMVGDGFEVKRAIQNLTFGDMQTFDDSLQLTLAGLIAENVGQRHAIVISDGDPTVSTSLLNNFKNAGVTLSTVGVFPHSPRDLNTLKRMANITGGRFYEVTTQGALASLPQIFIKEAQTVKRSLIWEGQPFTPTITASTDTLRGITGLPPISGYVVAADREGLAQVTIRGGAENDPIGAQWQYGLGRTVVFTSDAAAKWASAWPSWSAFRQFWEQHVRWAMRPSGSANVMVRTEDLGDSTRLVVDAVGGDGARLPTGVFKGRVATPDGEGQDVDFRQTAPGRWEAVVNSEDAGTYVASIRYAVPDDNGQMTEGTAQAAITRPFADEFRALQDNAPLLTQVAEMTGGRVLSELRPGALDLWARDGLEFPVRTQPIWLAVACIAIALFLFDVAVRRVRIDFFAVVRGARKAAAKSKESATTQLDALQTARAKAKDRMQSGQARSSIDADVTRGGAPAAPLPVDTARRKFEATDEQAWSAATGPVALSGQASEESEIVKRRREEQQRNRQSQQQESEQDGMSRLLKAKKRAQEESERDNRNE
jgi:uncharacterized membrane protein